MTVMLVLSGLLACRSEPPRDTDPPLPVEEPTDSTSTPSPSTTPSTSSSTPIPTPTDTAGFVEIGRFDDYVLNQARDGGTGTGSTYLWLTGPQVMLCQYGADGTLTTTTAEVPCTDSDGFPCRFAFDVYLENQQIWAGLCNLWTTPTTTGGHEDYPLGFIEDFREGGLSLGPSAVFYYNGQGYRGWYRSAPSRYDPLTRHWETDWPYGVTPYWPTGQYGVFTPP